MSKESRKTEAKALRNAAKALRVTPELLSPYVDGSGYVADDWGNAAKSIDTWYAYWLEERADRIEARKR